MSDLRVACIGVGGQGRFDSRRLQRLARVVAICDVDSRALAAARRDGFGGIAAYSDFRRMLTEEEARLDAVCISSPDHTHAPAALMAMAMGKHCFCQKPLASTLHDTRRLQRLADGSPHLRSQMAVQGLFHPRARAAAKAVSGGLLGTVREVHAWTDRPDATWPQRRPRLGRAEPPPELDWERWLGPVPERPYRHGMHPSGWRGWHAFGTGALGDLGSHVLALAFVALGLRPPLAVRGHWEDAGDGLFPSRQRLEMDLPDRDGELVRVHWYDGGLQPSAELCDPIRVDENGAVLVGSEGRLYIAGPLNRYLYLLPEDRFVDHGFGVGDGSPADDVYEDFLAACRDGRRPVCDFATFAAPLTETLLAANLCSRLGRSIEWCSETLTVPGLPAAAKLVSPPRREDW